ncbi:MAG: mechanosensitive ion channel family protein [Xanthomonadales bacterium]|nr:mechanosensitive ion channel family protein [Xanthomonadales bacterium]
MQENQPQETPDLVEELTRQVTAQDWVPEALKPVSEFLAAYPWVAALSIALVGFFIAKLFVFALKWTLSHLTTRTKTDFDDKIIQFLSRPLFVTVFYGFLTLATITLDLPDRFTIVVIRILASLAIIYWFAAGLPVMALLLDKAAHWQDKLPLIQDRTLPLFDIVGKLLVVLIASYALLQVWNIDATAWLASAGVIGIAVGFAARDTLANLFSGVFIVADAPYKIGDYINLDSGERGMVTHVGLRSTRILTRDDVEITVPNAVMGAAKIVNEAGGRWEKMRVRIRVGVAYGTDVDQVCEVLQKIGEEHPALCEEPPVRVRMRGFGDSSLDFELLGWIERPELRGRITHELLMTVYKRFAEENIEIPFPQRDLYIKSMPEAAREG